MFTKIINKFEHKLTQLLLSFVPLALLFIYLILNNMLNENNWLVISLAFNSLKYYMSSNNTKYFIQFILWTMSSLIVEYAITIPKLKWAIILANGIVLAYVFELISTYFKQQERKQND